MPDKNNRLDVKMLIFDWSGVISDDRMPVYESNMRVMEAHGIKRMSFEEWLPQTKLSAAEFFASQGLVGDTDTLNKEYSDMLAVVKKDGIQTVVYEDAKTVLEKLSLMGKELIVISSHPQVHLLKEAQSYSIKKFFSKFVGSVKNKAQELSDLCSKEEAAPDKTAYVGDTIYDIQAAKTARVHSIGITTGYHVRERLLAEKPEFVVDSLSELRKLVH